MKYKLGAPFPECLKNVKPLPFMTHNISTDNLHVRPLGPMTA